MCSVYNCLTSVHNTGVVHLTGYLVPEEGPDDEDFDGQLGDEMSDLEEDESEEESDEDEDEGKIKRDAHVLKVQKNNYQCHTWMDLLINSLFN